MNRRDFLLASACAAVGAPRVDRLTPFKRPARLEMSTAGFDRGAYFDLSAVAFMVWNGKAWEVVDVKPPEFKTVRNEYPVDQLRFVSDELPGKSQP